MTCLYCDREHVCVTEAKRERVCLEHYNSPPPTIEDRLAAIERLLGKDHPNAEA